MPVTKADVNKAWRKYDKYQRDSEKTGRYSELYANRLMMDAQLKQKEYQDYSSRKKNPTVGASSLPIGEWSPAHAVRKNTDGTIDILREKNSGKRRANISEGWYSNGVFHPIRAAADYDPSRVGEKRQYAGSTGRVTKKKVKIAKGSTYASRVKKLAKSHPFKLWHKERGHVKGFATKAALDAEYKRRGGARNGYIKK